MNISCITFVFVSQLLTDLQTDIVLDLVVEVVVSHSELDIIRNRTLHWLNMFLCRQKSADNEVGNKNPSSHLFFIYYFHANLSDKNPAWCEKALIWNIFKTWTCDRACCIDFSSLEATVNLSL